MSNPTMQSVISHFRHTQLKMYEFLDLYPLPTTVKGVECQSVGRNFHFLHSLNPAIIKSEAFNSLNCTNSFWNLPDINVQFTIFIDNWGQQVQ